MTYVALVIIVFFVTFVISIVAFFKFFASIIRKTGQLFSKAFSRVSDGVSSASDTAATHFPDLESQLKDYLEVQFKSDDLPENSEGILDENDESKAEKKGLKIQINLSRDFTNTIKNDLESAFDFILNSEFLKRNFKKLVLKIHEFNRELDRELHPEFYEELERKSVKKKDSKSGNQQESLDNQRETKSGNQL